MAAVPSGSKNNISANIDPNENYTSAISVLASLFFIWAMVTNINDILIPHLKKACELTDFQSSLVQFAFFGAYFVMSLPSGAIIKKIGYKNGILVGLATMFVGAVLFIPAAYTRIYPVFLLALFVLGSGITLLQVAANPYVALLGNPNTAASRLNFTQAINSLGASLGPFIGGWLILSGVEYSADQWNAMTFAQQEAYQIMEARSVIIPYVGLACILTLISIMIYYSNLPEIENNEEEELNHHVTNDNKTSVWQYKQLTLGVVAIFLYVGAEVAIGSFIIAFAKLPEIAGLNELSAKNYTSLYMLLAMVGRFMGAAVMTRLNPGKILAFASGLALVFLLIAIYSTGKQALFAVCFVGFCNSIMFPTIFTLGIKELGQFTKAGSSYLIMAIVGGAIIPPIMGLVSDSKGIQLAFYVPFICYFFVAYYGLIGSKVKNQAAINAN